MSDQPLSNTIVQIVQVKEEILALNVDVFTRKSELGTQHYFQELESDFLELQKYLKKFTTIALSEIPENNLTIILQQINVVKTAIVQIKSFSLTPPQQIAGQPPGSVPANYIQAQKTSLITTFKNSFRNFFNATNSLIVYGINASSNVDDLINKKDELNQIVDDSKRHRETLQNITTNTQILATDRKLTSNKSDFDKQASEHNEQSWKWLIAAGIIFILILTYILCGFGFQGENLKEIYTSFSQELHSKDASGFPTYSYAFFLIQVIKMFLIRILVISFGSFLLVFFLKNYTAQKHNAEVKQHKANCIAAYQFLEKSLSSPTAKDEVLSLVLKAVFEQQETAFRGDDAKIASPNMIANVIEAVKLPKAKE